MRTLNSETGNLNIRYLYKRKPISAFLLNSKLSEKLAGYSLIEKDLLSVIGWLETINEILPELDESLSIIEGKDRKKYNLIKSLFVSSLTFYGKCFTKCAGRGSQLNIKTLDKQYRDIHLEYMMYRHSFAAHSGEEKIETAKTVLLINIKNDYEFMLAQTRMQPDVVLNIGNISFIELINHALEKVRLSQVKLNDKIMDDEIMSKDLAYWKKKCKKKTSINLKI